MHPKIAAVHLTKTLALLKFCFAQLIYSWELLGTPVYKKRMAAKFSHLKIPEDSCVRDLNSLRQVLP
jgi:hypothetical protein